VQQRHGRVARAGEGPDGYERARARATRARDGRKHGLAAACKRGLPAAAAARALLAPIGAATLALAPLPLLPALPAALWAGLGLGATALLAWRALSPADRALLRQPRALFKTGAA